jgi:hypothetical protein
LYSFSPQGAADVASQVVSRLLALLKDKERKWRLELHRASQLEGENAELRARLAAAEQSNGRLRSRLHSGVAAFHRTLAQTKHKMEATDGELSAVKAQALELQGKLEARSNEAGRLRQQVSLLHRWCSSSSSLWHEHGDADHFSSPRHPLAGRSPWQTASQGRARTRQRAHGQGGLFDDGPVDPWEDGHRAASDSRPVWQRKSRGASRAYDKRADERWREEEEEQGQGQEAEAEVEARLQELAALRALRKSIQSMRSASGVHSAQEQPTRPASLPPASAAAVCEFDDEACPREGDEAGGLDATCVRAGDGVNQGESGDGAGTPAPNHLLPWARLWSEGLFEIRSSL